MPQYEFNEKLGRYRDTETKVMVSRATILLETEMEEARLKTRLQGLTEEGRRARKESRALMNYVKSDKGQKEAEKLINVYSRQAGFMSKDGNELTMKNLRTVANQDVLGVYGLNK